jgi:TrpR-related protein YerC/YecD
MNINSEYTRLTEMLNSKSMEFLCTPQELRAMSQRLEVAKGLAEKKTYEQISTETSASTAIISRVKRSGLVECISEIVV